MIFDNEETRDAYFKRVEANVTAVEYGDALRQADADLGFWGSDDNLFDDCSRIMLAEVNKFACSRYREPFCRLVDIQHSIIWHSLYDSARLKPRRKLAKVCEELGRANDNDALILEAAAQRVGQAWFGDKPPYEMVYEDIRAKGLMPRAIT